MKKSHAESFAESFFGTDNVDGQVFTSPTGESFSAKLEEVSRSILHEGDRARYEFDDGSCIVIAGDAWDYGFAGTGCFCWLGVGHHAPCALDCYRSIAP